MLPSMPILNLNSLDSPEAANELVTSEVTNNLGDIQEDEKPNALSPVCHDSKIFSACDFKESYDEAVFVSSLLEKRKIKTGLNSLSLSKKKKSRQLDEGVPSDNLEETESSFAEAYFLKVMKTVDKDMFEHFITLLLDYETNKGSRVELFRKVENLFYKFPDLINEFLGFLPPQEALECQKLKEKVFISESWNIFKHIEPTQMNKLITILEQHLDNTNMSAVEIKELISSLFKNQPQVAAGISSLFMSGPPPQRDDSSYERVPSLNLDGDSHEYEAVSIPMQSVRECSACPCLCHTDPDALCAACHITVFNCKIYIKKNKVLRTAKIEFDGFSNSEIAKKLNPEYFARREALEMMASSPSKVSLRGERKERKSICETEQRKLESSDELETKPSSNEKTDLNKELVHKVVCEEDKFGNLEFFETTEFGEIESEKQKTLSPKKRKSKPSKPILEKIKANLFPDEMKGCNSSDENQESKLNVPFENNELPCSEVKDLGLEESQTIESKGDLSLSDSKPVIGCSSNSVIDDFIKTEQQKMSECESFIDIKEEIKQEMSEGEVESMDVKISSPLKSSWTREEDKVILEAFRKEIDTEHTFSKISSSLPNRSVQDIQSRFRDLMILLERITGGTLEN